MTFVSFPSTNNLSEGEQLALNAFRCMAIGCDESDLVAAFDARFGVAGRLALGALFLLVREMGAVGGRQFAVAAPGSCRLTADEAGALALLSAGQQRDECRLDAAIAALFAGRDWASARAAAVALGGLFKAAGLTLRVSSPEPFAPVRAPEPVQAVAIGAAR